MHIVKEVAHLGGYRLRLRFSDGAIKVVDMEPHLEGEVFAPLRDLTQFTRVRVDTDTDTIVWENGADVAPEFLYSIGRDINAARESLA